ncbi:AMP-binding protein [Rhodococcus sp. X156]|uniref:AMP-binding protein n=1 Tax=Rhodococcus sp. X156 TaxID=2499145 RepID=UPI000FD82792|nr:AMP-binding protein [Rhodococcus sp. X156]
MNPVEAVRGPLGRLGSSVLNGLEVLRLGGLDTEDESAPYEVVTERRNFRLRHYFPAADDARDRPVALLVPPMMLDAGVFDVSHSSSAVTVLDSLGIDTWVIDFGAPDREEGGLERNLTDHVLAINEAVDLVCEAVGHDISLAGYSQGGMFCYQAAAYRRSKNLVSVVTFGSAVDTRPIIDHFGLPEDLTLRAAGFLAEHVFPRHQVPAWLSNTGFRLLDPVKSVRSQVEFVLQLHDREALLPRERQRRFLGGEGFVAWSGPAVAELLTQFVVQNRMLEGGFVIDEESVTLADITCPVFAVVGTADSIAPAAACRAIGHAAPQAEVHEMPIRAGHFGLVVGSASNTVVWPTVAGWLHWLAGQGPRPQAVAELGSENPRSHGPSVLTQGVNLVADVGLGTSRSLVSAATRSARLVAELGGEAFSQLPRLARLEQITPRTRISMASLLDEQADRAPEDVCFMFAGRAHTHGKVKERIDNVVRGLLSTGVRQGEHVGVLMETRPSAFTVLAALSRVGAVAVMLRPDGDTAKEAKLGGITRVIADPELASHAVAAEIGPVYVLGGGGDPRELDGVIDMERIDPAAVTVPSWYRPNLGRAADLAFILFTGSPAQTRVRRISNHRWALSAFGTASSASLSPVDTLFCLTPLHHPSGLMTTLGAALASGSRIAFTTGFDPATFWEEVRRYGVTVVSYTWTMLHALVEAPVQPGEAYHPVRLFLGSGAPRGLTRRLTERFAPAKVVEFYATTEGEAILVNRRATKPGSMGRALPGTARLRVAAYDVDRNAFIEDERGYARQAGTDEIGMLLARADNAMDAITDSPLRGVFAREDAWHATGDLFWVDADGDHWLVDNVATLMRTSHGVVFQLPVQYALSDTWGVDLCATYPVPSPVDGEVYAVAAVTLRHGRELTTQDVTAALSSLAPHLRPDLVHVVDSVPTTTVYRLDTTELRSAGLPKPGPTTWWHDPRKNAYVPLTAARRRTLSASKPASARRAEVRDPA